MKLSVYSPSEVGKLLFLIPQHYASFFNSLRAKEFKKALDSLYHYFEQQQWQGESAFHANKPAGESEETEAERCHRFRYAALTLAALHCRFGHRCAFFLSFDSSHVFPTQLNSEIKVTFCRCHVVCSLWVWELQVWLFGKGSGWCLRHRHLMTIHSVAWILLHSMLAYWTILTFKWLRKEQSRKFDQSYCRKFLLAWVGHVWNSACCQP